VKLLVLRPQPGADETAGRAIAKGLEPVVAPLFHIRPLDWQAPDPGEVEAVILTSANAARHGGTQLAAFAALPCYAVGEATAAAAEAAGFNDVRTGPSDAAALGGMMARDGMARALHLLGRDHVALDHPQIEIVERCVYAAEAADALPDAVRLALEGGPLALLHSPRAAKLFGALIDAAGQGRSGVSVAAISEAAAAAAGCGWRSKGTALAPRDDALLELAAAMCKTGAQEMGIGG